MDELICISLILAVPVVIIVVAHLIKECTQKVEMHSRTSEVADEEITCCSLARNTSLIQNEMPIRLTPHDLIKFTNNYAVKLGSGEFGELYGGQFPNGIQIAVKVLNQNLGKKADEQLMAEVGTLAKTNHINVVIMYGFCYGPEVKAVVYEYTENGSLDRYLFDIHYRLDWLKLYEIAVGTAKGICYLHEGCRQKIVHFGIKPGVVLLDTNFSAKLADFRLAKFCNRDAAHISNIGARDMPSYATPEMWEGSPLAHKFDVYSYGMLLFEIIGGNMNLVLNANESREWLPRWIWGIFEKGQLNSIKCNIMIKEIQMVEFERMCKVGFWCIHHKADVRPTMSDVVRMLQGQEEIKMPPYPFWQSPHFVSNEVTGTVYNQLEGSVHRLPRSVLLDRSQVSRETGLRKRAVGPFSTLQPRAGLSTVHGGLKKKN